MSGDIFTSVISSVVQTFQVMVFHFKMCSVSAHLSMLALKKNKLALFKKAERFFTAIVIIFYLLSQVIYFYSKNNLRIIVSAVFSFSF